ncbi:MAG TPA: hypothetical protein VN025_04895 [Candidatus Dormibacteraeota bacterium]|jgi:hypothetical protein|nr:hypothetical protein [Candidatus Dormibacteraeota bacterium]
MKQKKQIIVLIALVLVAGAIWGWQSWSPGGGSKPTSAMLLQNYQTMSVANPEIRWWEIELRRKAEYKSSGGSLFSTIVPPSEAEVRKAAADAAKITDAHKNDPPPPPPPLELPMKFFGYGTVPNGTPRRAFLSEGDEVYIVSEGDTLMGRFRILKINNASLEFEELSSGRHGQKMLEDQGPTT